MNSDIFVVLGCTPVEHNQSMPPGRPPKNGKTGKRWNIYCTEEDRELVRSILALETAKKDYLRGWLDRGANIGGKK